MSDAAKLSIETAPVAFLTGGGEMGDRIRAFDWSKTALGPAESWSPALRTVVRLMLANRLPMLLWWGPHYISIYNDPYRLVLGNKHPWGLGLPVSECWKEIWHVLKPLIDAPFHGGPATWDEDILLVINRYGFNEETHWLIAYSPVPDESAPSGIGGVLATVHETTEKVLNERRMAALRDLGIRPAEAKTAEAASVVAASALEAHGVDVPFALLYLTDEDGRRARLAATAGVPAGPDVDQQLIDLEVEGGVWPLAEVKRTKQFQVVGDVGARFPSAPPGPWPDPPTTAVVLPIGSGKPNDPAGFLVAGVSSRLRLDDAYLSFLGLVTSQIGTAIANAQAYEEERRRAEFLAELDRAKTTFFSNVSHEFRTPLTLILGPLDDAINDAGERLQRDRLLTLQRNALRLQKLVNTLLDFSRIEARRVKVSFQPVDLAALTRELASNFLSACEKANLELVVDCTVLPEPVHVDAEMWEKIVLNLVSNAFKFTLHGRIEVLLRQSGSHAELVVRDTGVGIPADQMPRLFERFHRVEGVTGRTQEGSGIGLALVRELVRLHGGEISARSVLGQGTSFLVRVPFGVAHLQGQRIVPATTLNSTALRAGHYVEEALRWLPDANAGEGEPLASAGALSTEAGAAPPILGERPRILLVDDNADMRQYLQRLLSGHYQVEAAPDGRAALEAVRRSRPDLILSDVMMPRLDGFGLLREIRADPALCALPVILLSARAGEESRVEGMEARADDYLVKPFGARELLARVSAHLQIARLRREAERSVRESEARFRAFVTASSDVVYRMNADWSEMHFLQGRAFIADTHEPSRTWLEEYIAPDDRPQVMHVIREAIRTRGVFQMEHRVRRVDGTLGWTISRAVPLLNSDGEIVEWLGAASDVTARKRAEEELQKERDRLRVTLASIGDAVITTDTEGNVAYLNGVAESLTGWTNAEASGQALDAVFHILNEDDRNRVENPAMTALREGVVVGLANHTVLIRKDGAERPIDDSAAPVRDGEGRVVGCVLVFRDVTERRRAETILRRQASLLEQTHDAIFVWEFPGPILYWNRAAEQLYGFPQEEALGTCSHDLLATVFPQRNRAAFEAALEQHGEFKGELVHTKKNGERITVESRIRLLTETDGKRLVLETSRDITERKAAEEDQRRLLAALSEADRHKNEFLATLAHELRNPLAAIRNALHIIRASPDRQSREQAHTLMERQLAQMVRLVDDLMDVSRISRGKVELRKEPLELAKVVQQAVETSRPLIEAMEHDLTLDVPAEPIVVNGDLTRLAQAFANLLNNAAKYTERGGRIALRVEQQGNDAVVSVRDTGVGIPAHMLPRVFEMFTQVGHSLERSQGGLGIGLALVKGMVEMHGGRVEARSAGRGKGSEFVVRLPAVLSRAGRKRGDDADQTPTAPKTRRRILVADDNQDSADSLALLLKIMGNDTETAHDGLEVLEAAASFRPDVMLLDIGMPKLNGYETARRIRQQAWGSKVLLVAQTGWGHEDDRRLSKEAGFDVHMVKPIDPAALVKLLAELEADAVSGSPD